MLKYCLVCLLLGAMALGQASPNPAAGQPPAPATPEAAGAQTPPDATVITIKGFCSNSAAEKDPAGCVTTISRAEFEKIVDAVQPSMPPRSRRAFADRYARTLVMAKDAQDKGLDKTANFDERMKLVRIQILAQELSRELQEQASQVPDKDIEDYYNANKEKYEEVDLDRIYIPKEKTIPDGQKTPTAEEEKKFQEESAKVMKAEADRIRARAAAGGEFTKLQEQAFEAAGIKSGAPTTVMGKVRRNILGDNQNVIMAMKPGEISPVIVDPNGFYVYKMNGRDMLPLDKVRDEIKAVLRSERLQKSMQTVQESVTLTLDNSYFGPEMPMRGPTMPMPHPNQPPAKPAPAEPK